MKPSYTIVKAFGLEELIAETNEMIAKGYWPVGGPFSLVEMGHWGQAVVSVPEPKHFNADDMTAKKKKV